MDRVGLIVSLMVIGVGVWQLGHALRVKRWPRASATVIGHICISGSEEGAYEEGELLADPADASLHLQDPGLRSSVGGHAFYPVYRFSTAEGEVRRAADRAGSQRREPPLGASLIVAYDPTSSDRVEAPVWTRLVLVPVLLLGVGGVIAIACLASIVLDLASG
jgi:hypothetical protein